MAETRKKRYVDDDINLVLYMEDAESEYKRKNLGLYSYMYELQTSEEDCIKIFREEHNKHLILNKACVEAEAHLAKMGKPQDVYNIVKCAYTLDTPLYGNFNFTTRDMMTFFEWQKFDYKGLWLLLHKADGQDPGKPETVYKGTSSQFQAEVGSVIKFKSFTSSTVDQEVAFEFIGDPKGSTLFQISKITNGLSLSDVSDYPEEAEFLIRPHEGFRVTHVKKESSGLTIISLESLQMSVIFWTITILSWSFDVEELIMQADLKSWFLSD